MASSRIPKIIHQMWFDRVEMDNEFLPQDHPRYSLYSAYAKTVKDNHPDYQYIFWNGRKILQLWADPRLSKWVKFFSSLKYHIEKCDMTRYAILYLYGGIYMDLDFESYRPFDPELLNNPILFIREPVEHTFPLDRNTKFTSNGIIFSSPSHPIWPVLLDGIIKYYSSDDNAVGHTGPGVISRILKENNAPEAWFADSCLFIPHTYGGKLSRACSRGNISHAYTSTKWNEGTGWSREYAGVYARSSIGYGLPILLIILLLFFLVYTYFKNSLH